MGGVTGIIDKGVGGTLLTNQNAPFTWEPKRKPVYLLLKNLFMFLIYTQLFLLLLSKETDCNSTQLHLR